MSGAGSDTKAAVAVTDSPAVLPTTTSATPVVAPAAAVQAARRAARSPLARAQASAGELAPRLQYQLARLGPAGQTGLAALVAGLVFAASTLLPAQHALESLSTDLARAQHASAAPGPDQAVPRLVESLPTRTQIPGVIGLIYAEASKSGVPLDVGHYSYSPPKSGALARYDVEFPVKAGYPQIRRFVNGTLTAVPAASLTKLRVERKTVGDASVNADIGFAIFVRSE